MGPRLLSIPLRRLFGGVQVISQIRSNQKVRLHKREQHVADYFAPHPGTPHTIRIRGGDEVIAIVGSARLYVCSHNTQRFVAALKYEGEETYRSLIASDLSRRTLDIVQGQTLRWLVEVFIHSMIKFFVLDASSGVGGAVSIDPTPDIALLNPSSLNRSASSLDVIVGHASLQIR